MTRKILVCNNMSRKFFELFPPSLVANISWKHFLGALFFRKVPLETGPPNFLMLPMPLDGGNKDGILGGGVNKYYGGIYSY